MNRDELARRCREVMLTLDVPVHENAALNAADRLAALLSELTDDRFIRIPGTKHYVLADDTRHARHALSLGRLNVDSELEALPEFQSLKPGDVVLDLGAFVGDTALSFLNKGCEVFAFEPYADAFEAMRRNVGRNPLAHLYERAAGDGTPLGTTGRFGEPDGNLGTRMVGRDEFAARSLPVDELELLRVDFAKIDVEGCEPMVLDGMAATIRRCKPLILIECYDDLLALQGFSRADVHDRLKTLGYGWRVAIGNETDPRVDYLAFPENQPQ